MKKHISLILIMQFCAVSVVFAQLEGKRFISGLANIQFINNNPDMTKATHDYAASFNVGLGKFKTENRASGWTINASLNGGKSSYVSNNQLVDFEGIKGFGGGIGHFWQFYKHFNDKFGIFAGPNVGLFYGYSKELQGQESTYIESRRNAISLTAGIDAGLYFKLSEKWWLLGSLGFSTPISAKYEFQNYNEVGSSEKSKVTTFTYGFNPTITFPSVGLGLRYFLTN